jgi:hypothetical protein
MTGPKRHGPPKKNRSRRRIAPGSGDYIKSLRTTKFGDDDRHNPSWFAHYVEGLYKEKWGVTLGRSEYHMIEDGAKSPRPEVVWALWQIHGGSLEEVFEKVYGLPADPGTVPAGASSISADASGKEMTVDRLLDDDWDVRAMEKLSRLPRAERKRILRDAIFPAAQKGGGDLGEQAGGE